jgi:hypothetical protein
MNYRTTRTQTTTTGTPPRACRLSRVRRHMLDNQPAQTKSNVSYIVSISIKMKKNMRSRYICWTATTSSRWVRKLKVGPWVFANVWYGAGRDRSEEHSRTGRETQQAKYRPRCPQYSSPQPNKEGPSTGTCPEESASARRQWSGTWGSRASSGLKARRVGRNQTGTVSCDPSKESRPASCLPRLTALQAVVLQRVA